MDELKLFLSYNASDHPSVVAVQKLLAARAITTFVDRDQLVPGMPWPKALEEALRGVRAAAVFIGRELGGWQKREMWFVLDRQVSEEKQGRAFPVIPVLLAGADLTASFLFSNTWIDLRGGVDGAVSTESLDAFERAINATEPAPGSPERAAICPYRGLEAFREEDAAFFAGRSKFATDLLNFTLGKNLVAVVGPSGSGKSSIVQAGLVPLLRRQLPPATTWDVVTFTPGSDPFHRLASALIPLLKPDGSEVDRLAEARKLGDGLRAGEIKLESVFDRVITKLNGTGYLGVVADQFEELFTLTPHEHQRPFAAALLHALGKARFTLLLTLRADYYSQIITLNRELSDRLAPAQVNIGAFTRDELRKSITIPAELVGLEFEAGLVDRILDDVGSEPGNLPLLEFALTGLWSKRHGRTLTNAAYNEIGGVTGALAERAETEFAKFTAEEQAAARRLFSRLVRVARPDEGTEDTRQRLELKAADTVTEKVAQALARPDVRLLVLGRPDKDPDNASPTVEVAHEALIRNWERLRSWLNEDREFLLWRQRNQVQVEEWEHHRHDASYLLRGGPLSEAERWLIGRPQDLLAGERQFIGDGVQLRKQEQAAEERRRKADVENAERLKEAAEASAETERQRAAEQASYAEQQKKQATKLRWFSSALTVLLLLAIVTAAFASYQRATARARELVSASIASQYTYPDLSVLFGAQSVAATWPWGHTILPEAEQQLHRALLKAEKGRVTFDGAYSAAWSPDSKRLATGSRNGTAKVWNAADGKELLTLRGHTDKVYSVAWSPDGKRLATGSGDQTAKVWNAATGKELLTLHGHTDMVNSVAWSPDGKRLATGSGDQTARVWDATNGQELLTMRGHSKNVDSVAWSPNGKRLATGNRNATAKVWDAANGNELQTLHGNKGNGVFGSVAWSPDGKRLATGGEFGESQVWDAATWRELLSLSVLGSVAWSPDGKRLATGGLGGIAKVWDAHSGEELLTLSGRGSDTLAAYLSPEANFMSFMAMTAGSNNSPVWSVSWSPDGKRLATARDTLVDIYTMNIHDLMTLAREVSRRCPAETCKKYLHVNKCPPFPDLHWW